MFVSSLFLDDMFLQLCYLLMAFGEHTMQGLTVLKSCAVVTVAAVRKVEARR